MADNINQLSKAITEAIKESQAKGTKPYDTPAEVKRVEDGTAWVHIPGGVDETPVKMTVACSPGDTVQVRVADGRAWITGNATAPPTDDKKAIEATKIANKSMAVAEEALNMVAGDSNQYFWHTESGTDTGSHITEIPEDSFKSNPRGFNVLIRSVGIALRNALTELMQITSTYIRLGKSNEQHVYIDNNSVDINDGDKTLASFSENSYIGDPTSSHIAISSNKFSASDVEGREVFTIAPSDSTILKEQHDVFEPTTTGKYTLSFLPEISLLNEMVVRLDTVGVGYFGETYELTFSSASDTPTAVFTPQTGSATQTWNITGALSGKDLTLTFSPALTQDKADHLSVGAQYSYYAEYSPVKIQGEPPIFEISDMEYNTTYQVSMTDGYALSINTESTDPDVNATWYFANNGNFQTPKLSTVNADVGGNLDVFGDVTVAYGAIKSSDYGTDENQLLEVVNGTTTRLGHGAYIDGASTTIQGNAVYINTNSGSPNTWTFGNTGYLYCPGDIRLKTNNKTLMWLGSDGSTYYDCMRLNGNNQLIIGYGLYNNSVGETLLDGNAVRIVSRQDITFVTNNGTRTLNAIGQTVEKAATKTVSSGSAQNLNNISLAAGTWIVTATARYAVNATGRRAVQLATTATGNPISMNFLDVDPAINGGAVTVGFTGVIKPTATTTYYLVGFQNSGGNLSCDYQIQAIRIV